MILRIDVFPFLNNDRLGRCGTPKTTSELHGSQEISNKADQVDSGESDDECECEELDHAHYYGTIGLRL